MLAATAVNEKATIVSATMTSISVNPRQCRFGCKRLDLIFFTESDLTKYIAAHNQFHVRQASTEADFVHG